jgi:hypothetical protein
VKRGAEEKKLRYQRITQHIHLSRPCNEREISDIWRPILTHPLSGEYGIQTARKCYHKTVTFYLLFTSVKFYIVQQRRSKLIVMLFLHGTFSDRVTVTRKFLLNCHVLAIAAPSSILFVILLACVVRMRKINEIQEF